MSVQEPKFENEERVLEMVVEPTVMALGTKAGVNSQASLLLLPPATTTVSSRVPGGGFEHCPVP